MKEWILSQLAQSGDVEARMLKSLHLEIEMIYIRSVCDSKFIIKNMITPFFEMASELEYQCYLESFPECRIAEQEEEVLEAMLGGSVVLFFTDKVLLFKALKYEASPVDQAKVETVVQGPENAFTENIQVNLNLLRNRYRSTNLRVELKKMGTRSPTSVALIYDEEIVDQMVLQEFRERLKGINVGLLQSSGQLHQALSKKRWELFPTMMLTERPDRTAKNLAEGKVVLIVEGTPFVIVVPTVFYDYFSSMDDLIQLPLVGRFLIIIRYLGLMLATGLPAFYVGLTSYNPELLRVQLALMIAGSRAAVPYPSFLEVLFMLLMMEFLTEASVRLPKVIGPTATTVGGLILGQAATEAGLVGNIMIIIVAAVAISNFVIPINMMGFAVRVVKYGLLLAATLFGMVGIVVGYIALIMYLVNLRSFGKPYLRLYKQDYPGKKGDES